MPTSISRRRFLKLGCRALLGGLIAGGGATVYATQVEPRWLRRRRITLSLPTLPTAGDGFTLALLTDLHAGRATPPHLIEEAVTQTNAAEPDVILLGGDFVTGSAVHARPLIPQLSRLQAPHGVFAVLGNHDVWTDASTVVQALEAADVTVLRDAGVPVGPVQLLGIEDRGATGMTRLGNSTDFATFRRRWESATAAVTPRREQTPPNAPRLLLVHNPDFTEMLPEDADIALALSGHTHGGQVQLPLFGAPLIPSCFGDRFLEGLTATRAGMPVYVSHGVGHISPGIRFNCRPEIAIVTLRSG
jgi:predicted MPP superfamily phosphohydrolase